MAEDGGGGEHGGEEDQQRRQQAPRSSPQELAYPHPPQPTVLLGQDRRDQEAAQHKEHSDPEQPAHEDVVGRIVEEGDGHDGEAAESVQGRSARDPPRGGRGSGRIAGSRHRGRSRASPTSRHVRPTLGGGVDAASWMTSKGSDSDHHHTDRGIRGAVPDTALALSWVPFAVAARSLESNAGSLRMMFAWVMFMSFAHQPLTFPSCMPARGVSLPTSDCSPGSPRSRL